MTEARKPTPAQSYRDGIWKSSRLTPVQRLVALCYADHAYGADTAWVAQRRLMDRCGIRSTVTATKTIRDLVDAGWLAHVGQRNDHKQIPVYRLTVPCEDSAPADGSPAAGRPRGEDGKWVEADNSEPHHPVVRSHPDTAPSAEPTAPLATPNRTSGYAQPHHPVGRTAPLDGAELSTYDSLQEEYVLTGDGVGAATLRAAPTPAPEPETPPGADPLPDDQRLTADDARARIAQLLHGKRRADTRHWRVGTAPVGPRNELYRPEAAAEAMAMLATIDDLTPATTEGTLPR